MGKKVFGILMAICITAMWFGPSQAAFIFNPATGHYYDLTVTSAGWEEAEAEAILKGGHLAAINDAAEETWIRDNIGTDRYWIGFTDKAVEGTWVWSNGDSATYTNWAGGEPNNMDPPAWGEDYAVMNWSGNNWNDWDKDRPDYSPIQGVIEKSVVPLPPSTLLLGTGLLSLLAWRRRVN